jgi:hypothetical protein
MIAPTSTPHRIYQTLHEHCRTEERHSPLITGYQKTFKRLARTWMSDGSISEESGEDIIAACNQKSWRMWRPILYVIPREPIESAKRLISVKHKNRAGLGTEMQIADMMLDEFDRIELWSL